MIYPAHIYKQTSANFLKCYSIGTGLVHNYMYIYHAYNKTMYCGGKSEFAER